MSKRCILVSFPHFPYSFKALLPDSLLAAVAGSLLDAGHRPLILDYATLDMFDRFFPAQLRRATLSLADQLLGDTSSGSVKALAAFLRLRGLGAGHRRQQARFRRDMAAEAAREVAGLGRCDLVVLSVREAADVRPALLLAERLRETRPEAVIVAAGEFIERYGELVAREVAGRRARAFDCLCLGDPEWTLARFAEVVDRPELWTETPNLAVVRGNSVRLTRRKRVDLNSVAIPDYSSDTYPALEGNGKFKVLGVSCTRVCSQQCPACPHGEIQPGLSRPRTPRTVCQALIEGMRQQNVCAFALEGPAFPETYAVSTAREILSRGLAVLYSREASIRETRVSNLATFKASGCQVLSFRVDTGSQWLLEDYYGRRFSVSECEKVLNHCGASGLYTIGRFTFPSPADDDHTRAETLRLLERVRPGSALLGLPDPQPGSEWFDRADEYGFQLNVAKYVRTIVDNHGISELPLSPWRTLLHARRRVSFQDARRELESLRGDVSAAGVSTEVTPELGLVARVSGYEGHEHDFAALMHRKLFSGDVPGLADVASRFNGRATIPAPLKAGGLYAPVLAAAGN